MAKTKRRTALAVRAEAPLTPAQALVNTLSWPMPPNERAAVAHWRLLTQARAAELRLLRLNAAAASIEALAALLAP